MSSSKSSRLLTPGQVMRLEDLIQVAPAATVSREIARSSGGTVTLFAFASGQELSEHTAPFDALVQVLDGELQIVIGGEPVTVGAGSVVLMPAHVPHALRASSDSVMLLAMLRNIQEG
jgi:quercetin dioxygenase-like cupin family protein